MSTPDPNSYRTAEGTLRLPDGVELYTKTWTSSTSPPRARLLFVHGFSDHSNGQEPFFPQLTTHGIDVHAFDQRGWGRSVQQPRDRGRTGPTTLVLADIAAALQPVLALSAHDGAPVFVMGHSMGGAEVLLFAAQGPAALRAQVAGFIAEAPLVALHPSTQPWKLTVVLGRLAARVLPHMTMVNKLDPNKLCRDPVKCAEWAADPLCHDTGTLEGLAGMLDRAAVLDAGEVDIAAADAASTRLLLAHAPTDAICDFAALKRYHERSVVKDKTLLAYDGWYHKLHVELGEDKVKFAADVAKWILQRTGGGEVQAKL